MFLHNLYTLVCRKVYFHDRTIFNSFPVLYTDTIADINQSYFGTNDMCIPYMNVRSIKNLDISSKIESYASLRFTSGNNINFYSGFEVETGADVSFIVDKDISNSFGN